MYTLRKISENQIFNQSLGNAYSVVDKDYHEKQFDHYYRSVYGQDVKEKDKNVIKFIVTSTIHPVYKDDFVYIMTESGETFECINNPHK